MELSLRMDLKNKQVAARKRQECDHIISDMPRVHQSQVNSKIQYRGLVDRELQGV